ECDLARVVREVRTLRDSQQRLKGLSSHAPQWAQSSISKSPPRGGEVPLVQTRSGQPLGDTEDHRRNTSSSSDAGFARTLSRLEIKLSKVGANSLGISTSSKNQSLVSILLAFVSRREVLYKVIEVFVRSVFVYCDDHRRRSRVVEELLFVSSSLLVGFDLHKHRTNPAHTHEPKFRVRDRRIVRYFVCRQQNRVRRNRGGVAVHLRRGKDISDVASV